MNGTRDFHDITPGNAGDGLDPREAASLLEQTGARRGASSGLSSPLLSAVGAAVLGARGAPTAAARDEWTSNTLDPLIHVPARVRIVATPAALPDGDARPRGLTSRAPA